MKIRERNFSGTKDMAPTQLEIKNRQVALEAAREGIVLLKNEQNILPLAKDSKIALFGGGACHMIKGGTGSGDVCVRNTVSVYDGLKEKDCTITSTGWLSDYEEEYTAAREAWKNLILTKMGDPKNGNFFDVYSTNAFRMPAGRPIGAEDLRDADTAVYVISRVAGEGDDRFEEAGDYYLTEEEIERLRQITDLCENVVVILNMGSQIDMHEILSLPQVKGILYISQPGMEGGTAVADVLMGDCTPSGKLTDTWALDYTDFPNADVFSYKNGDTTKEYYTEGIFVGYRYFDAFEKTPLYPFGYGLSYTDFDIQVKELKAEGNDLLVKVLVANTGSVYSGKEVVQVYAACPQNEKVKEMRRLAAFAKTKLLAPGEKQELTIRVSAYLLTSFDEKQHAFVLDEGTYGIFVGNSIQSAVLCGAAKVEETAAWEKLDSICPLKEELEEMVPAADLKGWEKTWNEQLEKEALPVVAFAPKPEAWARHDETELEKLAADLADQLSDEQRVLFCLGEVSRGHDVAFGASGIMVPGAAGETASASMAAGVPPMAVADGPAGIRIIPEYEADEQQGRVYGQGFLAAVENGMFAEKEHHPGAETYYQYCTAFPVGVMMAQTWNMELAEQVGKAVGEEMEYLGIALWLAPGMNIHRNPLCGRNFEYYAEDPIVSGRVAAAVTLGVQTVPGVGTTIKHFACNNLEANRFGSDSILSERTLREIYLKGFEIAVKTSQPMSVMSSYNLLNGIHTANCRDILETVLRGEWDFRGAVMSDWSTTGGDRGSDPAACVYAGNDLIMPGLMSDVEGITAALQDGSLSMEEVQKCNRRLMKLLLQTLVNDECESYRKKLESGYAKI